LKYVRKTGHKEDTDRNEDEEKYSSKFQAQGAREEKNDFSSSRGVAVRQRCDRSRELGG